jgi:hypothetical protein
MAKKLMLLAMAAGAFAAFAIPAAASANTGQLTENGVALKPPVTILATSVNTETETAAGTLVCKKVTLDLNITANSAASGSKGSGTGTAVECTIKETSIVVEVTKVTVGSIALTSSPATSVASFSFTYDIPAVGLSDCTLATAANKPAAVTWTAGKNPIHVAGTLVGSGTNCPLSGTLKGDYNLETASGTAVVAD